MSLSEQSFTYIWQVNKVEVGLFQDLRKANGPFLNKWHAGRKRNNSGDILQLGKLALFRKVEKVMCVE